MSPFFSPAFFSRWRWRGEGEGPPASHLRSQQGVTYLMVMCAIVLMGIAMTIVGKNWVIIKKRDQEAELLFRGNRMKAAIEAYAADYQVRKGTRPNQYPLNLDQLTLGQKRYLPVVYKDPITGKDFDVITINGEIRGIKSTSTEKPLNQVQFKVAGGYSQIIFQAQEPTLPGCPSSANPINPMLPASCPPSGIPNSQSAFTPANSKTVP